LEAKLGSLSRSSSPTLKIPNGAFGLGSPEPGLLSKTSLSSLFAGEGPAGAVKGYKCSFCNFNTPLLALLFIHERSHQGMNLSNEESKDVDDEEEEGELLQNANHLKLAHQTHLLKLQHQQQMEFQENRGSPPSILSSHLHRGHLLAASPPSTPVFTNNNNINSLRHKVAEQNKSETAVSIAKDQAPTNTTSLSSTPVPAVAQEGLYHPKPSTPVAAAASALMSPTTAPSSMPSVAGFNNILSDMSNITQRPAMYALPQAAGPFVMQSFLIAEDSVVGKQGNFNDSPNNQNRFVPAVVFLPVKERIMAPVTVSFTLNPA
jgi:zinc finger protein 423